MFTETELNCECAFTNSDGVKCLTKATHQWTSKDSHDVVPLCEQHMQTLRALPTVATKFGKHEVTRHRSFASMSAKSRYTPLLDEPAYFRQSFSSLDAQAEAYKRLFDMQGAGDEIWKLANIIHDEVLVESQFDYAKLVERVIANTKKQSVRRADCLEHRPATYDSDECTIDCTIKDAIIFDHKMSISVMAMAYKHNMAIAEKSNTIVLRVKGISAAEIRRSLKRWEAVFNKLIAHPGLALLIDAGETQQTKQVTDRRVHDAVMALRKFVGLNEIKVLNGPRYTTSGRIVRHEDDTPKMWNMPMERTETQKQRSVPSAELHVEETAGEEPAIVIFRDGTDTLRAEEGGLFNAATGLITRNPCREISLGAPEPAVGVPGEAVAPLKQEEPKQKRDGRVFVSDHFSLSMLKNTTSAIEQNRISRGEARLFVEQHGDRELSSMIRNEHMAEVLSDVLRVKLGVDARDTTASLIPGDIVIFVEERGDVKFWRLDVLVETTAQGSGKKAWSW
jgi:hypothetical protein